MSFPVQALGFLGLLLERYTSRQECTCTASVSKL
jgi:hypothetical protein